MKEHAHSKRPESRAYLERTIETVRIHRDAENSWPQWANIFADEIERLWRIEDAASDFLTACDEYGCDDAPLDQFATLVEAVSGLADGRGVGPHR